jgi:hypothetical protein
MRNKPLIFVLVFCASIFSNKIDAQYSIGIDVQLNHDTITYGQGFDILVTLTNTGSFAITTPIYLWYGSRSVNVLSIDPSSIYQFPLTIYPNNLSFGPNDSISINIQSMQNMPATTTAALQTGDNLIVIWPSSIVPINTDSGTTPVHVLNTNTSVDIISPINLEYGIIYDVFGRAHKSLKTLPIGSMYIRDGKKYIILKK